MARSYNVGPYNCGRYQSLLWDGPCVNPNNWIPGSPCMGGDYEETVCPGALYLEQIEAPVDWAESSGADFIFTDLPSVAPDWADLIAGQAIFVQRPCQPQEWSDSPCPAPLYVEVPIPATEWIDG